MTQRQQLIAEIEEFLRDRDMAETTFGLRAVNDGKFVGRLRAGKGVEIDTVDRVRAYIAEQKAPTMPADAA